MNLPKISKLIGCIGICLPLISTAAETACKDPQSCMDAAISFHKNKQFDKAYESAQKACDANFAQGCVYLGFQLQSQGQNTEANHYYDKACELNYSVGCLALANNLRLGLGIQPSAVKSLEYYEKACKLGDPVGCSHMNPHPGMPHHH